MPLPRNIPITNGVTRLGPYPWRGGRGILRLWGDVGGVSEVSLGWKDRHADDAVDPIPVGDETTLSAAGAGLFEIDDVDLYIDVTGADGSTELYASIGATGLGVE